LEAFIKLNESFMSMIKRSEMKQTVESGDFVITQVLMDVEMPSCKTIQLDITEWYEVKNGKISSMKIYYDAEEFRKEMV
jgi:limonene-1,2-epoxide hydrolase